MHDCVYVCAGCACASSFCVYVNVCVVLTSAKGLILPHFDTAHRGT